MTPLAARRGQLTAEHIAWRAFLNNPNQVTYARYLAVRDAR